MVCGYNVGKPLGGCLAEQRRYDFAERYSIKITIVNAKKIFFMLKFFCPYFTNTNKHMNVVNHIPIALILPSIVIILKI